MRKPFKLVAYQLVAALVGGTLLAAVVSTAHPLLTAGASLALGFLLLFLARPEWGLLFVLFARASSDASFRLLTVSGPEGQVVGGLPNIGLILILSFAGGIYILSRSVPMISLPGGRLLTLLLLTGFIGVLRADSLLFAMNEWVPVVASLIIYVLAAHLFASPRQAQRAVDVIAASFILPAALGIYQLIARQGEISPDFALPRIVGTYLHPNTFGFYLVVLIALFLSQALFQSGRRKMVAVAGLGVALVLLVFTYSRTAWVGAFVVLGVVATVRARVLFFLLPLGVLMTFGLVPSVGLRLADALARGGSLADRLYNLWPSTLQAWLSATEAAGGPFLVILSRLAGLGPGVGPALGRYDLLLVPHNDYLRVVVEYGVLGLILYFGLNIVLAVLAFRTWREVRQADHGAAAVALSFAALVLAFPVMSLTDNLFAHTVTQVYYWALAGLTVAMSVWVRRRSTEAALSSVQPHTGYFRDAPYGTMPADLRLAEERLDELR